MLVPKLLDNPVGSSRRGEIFAFSKVPLTRALVDSSRILHTAPRLKRVSNKLEIVDASLLSLAYCSLEGIRRNSSDSIEEHLIGATAERREVGQKNGIVALPRVE